MNKADLQVFQRLQANILETLQDSSQPPLPNARSVAQAAESLHKGLSEEGQGLQQTCEHLLRHVNPGLNGSSLSPTYYGFVTGGLTPAARLADNLVTLYDQNVSVHLPSESVATIIEDRGLCMLLELLNFDPRHWVVRTLTTGATASNILGLACGREYIISKKIAHAGLEYRQGEGLLSSCLRARVEKFQVLTTLPHSSLGKAANIVGLGSAAMIDVSKDGHFLDFDVRRLELLLATPNTASIVVISCGEVNTGAFATNSVDEVRAISNLCKQYGAWLHVDGAFGLFARALPALPQYASVRAGAEGLQLADSIGGDGHKLLNVPYDCGFFFCRHGDIPSRVFQNTNAAYLKGDSASADGIVSPLNIRLENSARFRGLPVYATLVAYGRAGYASMIASMVDLARKIAVFIKDECPDLTLLPHGTHSAKLESVYICVLFRADEDALNDVLANRIKASGKMYASGTMWEAKPAVRLAIAKWDVDVDRDFAIVKDVLDSVGLSRG